MQDTADMDKKRKLFLFSICAGVFIALSPVLLVINYWEGDRVEMIIDLMIIVILAGSFLAIKMSNRDAVVYRIFLFLICLSFFYAVSIGAADEKVLYWLYIMPIFFFFYLGKWEGLIWTFVFTFCLAVIILVPSLFNAYVYDHMSIVRFFITYIIIILVAFGLESSRHTASHLLVEKNNALLEEKQSLEKALNEIKTLSGLIPICSNCKKVRNDDGYWEQVEIYIRDHSKAVFNHSVCPDCAGKLYPEFKQALDDTKSEDGGS